MNRVVVMVSAVMALAACDQGPKSSYGFTLPEGDVAAGKEAFGKFRCADCHTVAGHPDLRQGIEPLASLPLGGRTPRVSTYGELVTAIINPSHVISRRFGAAEVTESDRSKMPNYNYAMTVNELVDVVAFLQAQYRLEPFQPTLYLPYVYPPVM